jgi:uncharacterized membrane protein
MPLMMIKILFATIGLSVAIVVVVGWYAVYTEWTTDFTDISMALSFTSLMAVLTAFAVNLFYRAVVSVPW